MTNEEVNRIIAEECFGCCKDCIEKAVQTNKFTKSINNCIKACEQKNWPWGLRWNNGVHSVTVNGQVMFSDEIPPGQLFADLIVRKILEQREMNGN